MRFLIDLFKLEFVPERDGVQVDKVDKPKAAKGDRLPDNVNFIKSQRAAYVDNGNNTWDIYGMNTRSAELTKSDLQAMTVAGLKEDKYRTIKAKWAIELSIKEASERLSAEKGKGFKRRTVSKYYAVINAVANPSPTESDPDRGQGHSKTPQKGAVLFYNVQY